MATIAVGGSNRGAGKTAPISGLIVWPRGFLNLSSGRPAHTARQTAAPRLHSS